ncbi:leucine-rich repeat receptor protein kinase MSP1 isoform X1 [Capsella rubella]|nr:leucine-rich repeat receptor protein kinase MSP1 isoform X1 [Capsella rubella]
MEGKVFLWQYFIWVILLLGQIHGYKSCTEKERIALLEIKKYLASHGIYDSPDLYYPFLPAWTNDTKNDCCQWEEINCDHRSGRVTEIAFGTLKLKQSFLLNLSLLYPFEEIRSLNLSGSRFRDLYPDEERGLRQEGLNQFNGFSDDIEGYKSLRRLRNLEILDLSSNKFNNSIFPFLSAATSLITLSLRSNDMGGPCPVNELKNLTNLELLDLSDNRFNGSIPVRELSSMRKLKALDLSDNEFSSSMELQGICKLKNMQELDLSRNKLEGQFPLCLTSLIGLRVLDLSSNQFNGKLPSSLGNLESLEYLSLFDNNFEGVFSLSSLRNLSNLRVLKFGSKSNSFQVGLEISWMPKFQLSVIVLRSCKLEKVPHFLLHQKVLRLVDLSDNKISGDFPSWLLENNTKLDVLLLQNNSLTSFQLPNSAHNLGFLDVSVNKFHHLFPENIGLILPELVFFYLAHNGFQGNLASSLGNMENISYLDVSHNSFHGKLPHNFLEHCDSLQGLKLSHNKLSGEVFSEPTTFQGLETLSMDNNQFTGKIGQGLQSLTSLEYLDISKNNLSGVIPSWIGEFSFLYALLLSDNSLEGEIPFSLFNRSYFGLLDLSSNSLSGHIPPLHVNPGFGVVLLLQDNNLSGVIPNSVLEYANILDLSNNRLSGNISEYTNAPNISILILRGNELSGRIPRQLCGLRNIHLLDLANNRLNGTIPSCLSNTSFGLGKESSFYFYDFSLGDMVASFELSSNLEHDSTSSENVGNFLLVLDPFIANTRETTKTRIEFLTKHRYDGYTSGILVYYFGLDLSENELSGEIPPELGDFLQLQSLNLSHNNLSGVIPKSFSGLKNVESLDLSYNILQGHIPTQLTDLNSLAVFNLSYNNFSGIIPQGKQFNTFDAQSYLGNPLLCGKQTNTSCNGSQEPDEEVEDDESTIYMIYFYFSFAAAYVTILIGLFTSLSFDSPWSRSWFYNVDVFIYKVSNLLG